MLLIILFGALGAILFLYGLIKFIVRTNRDSWTYWNLDESITLTIGIILLSTFVVSGMSALIMQYGTPAKKADLYYSQKIEELTNTYNSLTNAETSSARYTAIQQYNEEVNKFKTELIKHQYWLNNVWTNWFVPYTVGNYSAESVSYIVK